MIAVPVAAMLTMPAGLIALALMPLHLEHLALIPMGWGVEIMLFVAHHVSAWPVARLDMPPMPPWGIIAFSLGLAWLGICRSRGRWLGAPAMLLGLAAPLLFRPPDLLISADARLLGLRVDGQTQLLRTSGAQKFTEDAWKHLWLGEPVALNCPAPYCLLRPFADRPGAAVLRGDDSLGCEAALRISFSPIRRHCAPGAAEIDRFAVWREGAHAIWLDGAVIRIETDWQNRGARPWVLLAGPD
jgi:competence protein ComEC